MNKWRSCFLFKARQFGNSVIRFKKAEMRLVRPGQWGSIWEIRFKINAKFRYIKEWNNGDKY